MRISKFLISCLICMFVITSVSLAQQYDIGKWKGKSITVALDDRIENQRMQNLIPEFEKLTGIKVNLEIMPEVTLFEKVTLDVEAGTGLYDVIQYDFMRTVKFGPEGKLFALDKFIADPALCNSDWFSLDNFPKKYLDSLRADGKLFGLPLFCHVNMLHFRADLFEKYGILLPVTFEELTQATRILTEQTPEGVYGIGYRAVKGQVANIWIWSIFLHSYGGKFFDQNMKPAFNDVAGIEATNKYCELLQKYGAPGAPTHHWAELQSAFLDGKLTMVMDCDVFRTRAEDPTISKVAGKLGTFFVPFVRKIGMRHPGLWTWGIMIPQGAKNKEAAWQFVQWWTSTEVGIKCEYPSTIEATMETYKKFPNPPGMASFPEIAVRSMEVADPEFRPRIPEWNEIGDRLGIAVSEVLTKVKTTKEALNEAAKDIEKILAEAGYYK